MILGPFRLKIFQEKNRRILSRKKRFYEGISVKKVGIFKLKAGANRKFVERSRSCRVCVFGKLFISKVADVSRSGDILSEND